MGAAWLHGEACAADAACARQTRCVRARSLGHLADEARIEAELILILAVLLPQAHVEDGRDARLARHRRHLGRAFGMLLRLGVHLPLLALAS